MALLGCELRYRLYVRGTYVDDTAKRTDSIWPVNDLRVGLHVLHDTTCDHDDILCRRREFLDSKVHHLAEGTLCTSVDLA